jgi:type IV secretory pathway VirB10-like protein
MISRNKEKRFNHNQIRADETAKSDIRLSFLSKLTQRFSAKVGGAAISALIVLHFVSQFIFFQNENVQNENIPPKIENEQIVEIKKEYEPTKPDVVTTLKPTAPIIAQPERKTVPFRKVAKKKQRGESKAERLRRAERLLTGA